MKLEEGTKFDSGKPDWALLPLEAVEECVKVMTFGAKKYEPNNWKKIKDPMRYKAAMFRHMTAIERGEKVDPESGLMHISHVLCNAVFLTWFEINPTTKAEEKGV